MAAIEYGSYYWCVILSGSGKDAGAPEESVHLHADEMSIDKTGALTFMSAGRRPAGAEPKQQDGKENDKNKDSYKADAPEGAAKDRDDEKQKGGNMIYIAFAPGSWKVVYAAKLVDGSPASVEHWNAAKTGEDTAFPAVVPPNSGAVGYPPRE